LSCVAYAATYDSTKPVTLVVAGYSYRRDNMKEDTMKREAPVVKKVSPKTYAEQNAISTMTVYRMLRRGEIQGAVKLGSQWRIPVDA